MDSSRPYKGISDKDMIYRGQIRQLAVAGCMGLGLAWSFPFAVVAMLKSTYYTEAGTNWKKERKKPSGGENGVPVSAADAMDPYAGMHPCTVMHQQPWKVITVTILMKKTSMR